MILFEKYNFNKHRFAHLNERNINLLSDISNNDIDDMQLLTKSVNNKIDGRPIIIIRSILNNHPFVNLGLPSGTLWATCNVGAKRDDAAGKYFSWNTLRDNTSDKFEQLDINCDNCPSPNETLSLDNDAARINMGGKWHMPTVEQLQELYRNTTKEYIEDSKHQRYGVLLTGPNGNSIFLPETGYMDDTGICDGWESMILSNTSGEDAGDVCYGYFDVNFEGVANDLNYGFGAPTRGVINKTDWLPIKKYIDIEQIYENSNSSKSRSIRESKSSSEKKYVDAVIIADNKALILKRSQNVRKFPGKWGFVGGKPKEGEESKATAIRKIFEETGIKLTRDEIHNMEFLKNEKERDGASIDYWVVQLDYVPKIKLSKQHTRIAWHALNDRRYNLIFGKYYIMMDSFEVAEVGECLKVKGLKNNYSINESYEEPYNHLSDILANIIYNESFEEYCWSAFNNCYSNDGIRRKLIDGFCMEVCMFISSHYNIPEIEYYILDDKGDTYHFLMKYENKWYDAYNYTGVNKLEDLEFVCTHMSKYTENLLHTYLQLVSEGSFDYKRALELIREGCK